MKIFTLSFFIAVSILPLSAQHTILYGLTNAGGVADFGAIIRFDPATNTENVVSSFAGPPSDGSRPTNGLTFDPGNGLFYGLTNEGGSNSGNVGNGEGVIFSFDPVSELKSVVWDMSGPPSDGEYPMGGFVYGGGKGQLYAMVQGGGANGAGVIISFNPAADTVNLLYSFMNNGSDGTIPFGNMVYDPDNGLLYGLTQQGGTADIGSIISFNTVTGAEAMVYSFHGGADGCSPNGSMVYDPVNNLFYGMTGSGGADTAGVIFSFDPATGTEHVVWNFGSGTDGRQPLFDMIYDTQRALLYGMTTEGGRYESGVIFSFDPSDNTENVLWNFKGSPLDGSYPTGDLVYDTSAGLYYAMTSSGGADTAGVIFSFNPSTNAENVLWNFGGLYDGQLPVGTFVRYTAAPTGITPIANAPAINIYPNPTTGIISLTGLTSGQSVAVYDYLGEKINSITASTSSQQLDLSAEEAGIYLITISDRDGSVVSQRKVVKE